MRMFRYTIPAGGSQSIHHAGNFIRGISGDARYELQIDEGQAIQFETGLAYTAPESFRQVRVVNTSDSAQTIEVAIASTRIEDNRLIAIQPVTLKPAGGIQALPEVNGDGTIAANADRRELLLRAHIENQGNVHLGGVPLYPGDAMTLDVTGSVAVTADNQPSGGSPAGTASPGDAVGGGVYAGIHTYADGRSFHIIFGVQDSEAALLPWGNYGNGTGAVDPDDGFVNQADILANHDDGSAEAFYHCRDYVDAEGNADYYLPAENELALEANLRGHAELSTSTTALRWSSTEDSSLRARSRRFSDGSTGNAEKTDTTLRTRPIRRIPHGELEGDTTVYSTDGDRLHVAEVV